ncbi:MAG: sensor domain-containing diguanylate cyclase [Mariprofundales bacterium]|nr:sensor domain-containing diguanylate cyclase [Mariprofundales bacterium]
MLVFAEHNAERLALAEAINGRLSQSIDSYVIVSATDSSGIIVAVSQAFCDICGYCSDELIGQSHSLLRHPDTPDELFVNLWQTIQSGKHWSGELKNQTKDGGFFWGQTGIDPVLDWDGATIGYIAVRHDITSQKAMERLSITDPMTGAFNRRYFDLILPKELARAQREKQWLSFLMVDADNFKKYNDTYGHHAGDGVIKAIVDVLHAGFRRPSDFVFRLGGEEFAVLFPVVGEMDAFILADKARQAMFDQNIEHSGNPPYHRLTLSMGVITLDPEQRHDVDDVYKYSDIALYNAKENGRNRVEQHGDAEVEIDLF